MKINFKSIVRRGQTIILIALALLSASCRPESNGNQTIADRAAPRSPTPKPELNEKRLPAMSFRAWHRSKPGIILDQSVGSEYFHIAAPGEKPAPFTEYEIDRYPAAQTHRSHSGKFEVSVNKFNERSRNSGCCAIQEFDYETVVSEIDAPANRKVLSNNNWEVKGWSPDDRFILFSAHPEFFLVNAQTGEKTVIFSGRNAMRHVFDQTGKGLFTVNRSEETTRLDYFDFASQQLTTLLSPLETEPAIVLSPDGRRLALFTKLFRGNTVASADNFLYLFDTASKTKIAEHVLPTGGINYSSGWQPDGREFALTVGGENYTQDIYSVNVETGELTLWYPPKGETTGLYK